jgi:hypothetical protein
MMKASTMSLAVVALIGNVSAINIKNKVRKGDKIF